MSSVLDNRGAPPGYVPASDYDTLCDEWRVATGAVIMQRKELAELRDELDALKAGQGEAVAVLHGDGYWMWTRHATSQQRADSYNLDFRLEVYTTPPASADAVSVPGEFPAADDHEKAIGWEYSYEFISQVERLVASRTEFTTSMESVQETLKAACELRALLARRGVKS